MEGVKDLRVQNEGNVDRAYIVREADSLYKECLAEAEREKINVNKIISGKGKPDKNDLDFLDKLFERMRKEHKQLFETYPTVLRHMIQELQFDKGVFNTYLKGLEKNPWMNDSQRMDSYTTYAVLLYKHANSGKHMSKTQIELFRKDYRQRLQSEHDKFIETVEAHKSQVEKESAHYDESKKRDMIAMLKKQLETNDAAAIQPEETEREKLERLVKAGILSPDVLGGQ